MKRFYKDVSVAVEGEGFGLRLDGRAVKTPGRAPLAVPGETLAAAIAEEWAAQGETIDPRSMPLTGLANAAIDRIGPEVGAYAASLARYGESDLLCYRADSPAALVARQAEAWDPILDWARTRYDVGFELVAGIIHQPQPDETLARIGRAYAAQPAFVLAGLSHLVTVSGSAVIALAVLEGALTLDAAWDAATLDEQWQAEQWGADDEATKALASRRVDFEAGARFLELLKGSSPPNRSA